VDAAVRMASWGALDGQDNQVGPGDREPRRSPACACLRPVAVIASMAASISGAGEMIGVTSRCRLKHLPGAERVRTGP